MALRVREADPGRAGELARELGVSPATAQILLHRGIDNAARARDFLTPALAGLTPPGPMADRGKAARLLAEAIRGRRRIVVFGDYDVDGTTSAAILSGILEQLGGCVEALVADRFAGGYGFSEHALQRVLALQPELIVTCDCGSSDHPRIATAMARGVDVIVVDHHLVPKEPLPAVAFLNPHRPDCGFPYKGLASAGLVLSLGAAVRAQLDVPLDVRPWLDLVALGTIADVAPLDGDNRRLVRAGLQVLSRQQVRPGIAALREVARIRPGTPLGATDVAFRLTPRLNAPGRLGHQDLSLQLLRARSVEQARALAARVEQLNDERKSIAERVTQEALAQVRELYGSAPATGVVAAADGWHRGVVGIAAARVSEHFNAPAIVVALEGDEGHGSGRTPEGFPLYDAVASCSDALLKFGGHQAATGLTVARSQVAPFRQAFAAATPLGEAEGRAASAELPIDIELDPHGYDLPTADEMGLLEPVGAANAEPTFLVPAAQVNSAQVVGDGHLKLSLSFGKRSLRAFGPRMGGRLPQPGASVRVWGALRPDTWAGRNDVELMLTDLEAL